MHVRPVPGVDPHMHADGCLELHCTRTGRRFRCDEFGAAAWIALRQNGGDPTRAARTLALAWDDDAATVRVSLNRFVALLRRACLVTVGPERSPAGRTRRPAMARHLRVQR